MAVRDTYATITALIRLAIDDRDQSGGIVWSDADLLPFVNAELRDLNMMLIGANSMLVKKYSTHTMAATTDTTIDMVNLPTVGNILPADFWGPVKLWEKLSTDPDRQYTDMDETEERLPDIDQVDRLRWWMFTQGVTNPGPAIVTLGSTTTRIVRMLYFFQAVPFAQSTDAVPFPGAATALAYGALKKAAYARGEVEMGQYVGELYQAAYERFKRMHVKTAQRRGRRRVPFGMVRPYRF